MTMATLCAMGETVIADEQGLRLAGGLRNRCGALPGHPATGAQAVQQPPPGRGTDDYQGSAPTTHSDITRTAGALPDGTVFFVEIRPAVDDRPVGVSGMIVLDIHGVPNAVGPMQISFDSWWDTSLEDGLYRTSAGGHLVQIEFYDHVFEALGPDAEETIRSSIRGSMRRGYPALEVDPPFRWATDDELPTQMGVQFRTFEVRRGCSDLAAACSRDRTLQVIPLEQLYFPAPPWPDLVEVVVRSG